MRALTASALCLLAFQFGCSKDLTWRAVDRMIEANFPDVPTITTDSLAQRLADTTATRPVLLDARSPEEYAVSHLPGAHRVPPVADTIAGLDTLSRDTPIVVYCSVGYRSARVTAHLREQGFRNVSNLKGSIFRWANEGRTVVRDGTPVRTVHPYDKTWGTLLNDNLQAPSEPPPLIPSRRRRENVYLNCVATLPNCQNPGDPGDLTFNTLTLNVYIFSPLTLRRGDGFLPPSLQHQLNSV